MVTIMRKIEKCVCSCCNKEKMMFIFVTKQFGSLETTTNFKVDASYDNSTFIEGYILGANELKNILLDSSDIDIMCEDCLNQCNEFDITFEGEKEKHFTGISGKELIREILDNAISPDEGIWTVQDLENQLGLFWTVMGKEK